MQAGDAAPETPTAPVAPPIQELPPLPPTPLSWRVAILAAITVLGGGAFLGQSVIGVRGQAFAGILFFFGLVALFSSNLRAVNWRTIGFGILLQCILAFAVLKVPQVRYGFEVAGDVVKKFITFADKGAEFVFGNLAHPGDIALAPPEKPEDPPRKSHFMFAFKALPPILFVSAFFTLLYHFGILQQLVRGLSIVMGYFMRTSGAETLAVSANVFMGQTEAPLIVKPYVPRMTNSELCAMMTSGMAHISGAMMAVYINYGADAVSVLTTCVMACPCSLYLSKLFLPETSVPETAPGMAPPLMKSNHANAIDAIASGTSDGLRLALNVGAMLIVFIAFVAMIDSLLGLIQPGLDLKTVFGWFFSPLAFLIGVESNDMNKVGTLLGTKLALNEHVAYLQHKEWLKENAMYISLRSQMLTAFALTGFANFASVGIQLGGIGAMAPERRADLAKLGLRALFVGFVATLLNAAVAGVLLGDQVVKTTAG